MKTSTISKLLTLLLMLVIGNSMPLFSQSPEELFQKGMIKEEGEGSLQEAIDIYNEVVKNVSAERSLRAKALLQVGLCYEKLGKNEAIKSYEQLISDFSDQGDIVAIGRMKLSQLRNDDTVILPEGIVAKQIWSPAEDCYNASPDGRYITFIDWFNIELCVKDTKTGETWNLTNTGTWQPVARFPDNSIWSPDGKEIVYFWYVGDTTELHIINRDGTNNRILIRDYKLNTPWPVEWPQNSKNFLAFRAADDDEVSMNYVSQIVSVSTEDGSTEVISSIGDFRPDGNMSLSPDGRYIVYAKQQDKDSKKNDIFIVAADGSFERRLIENTENDIDARWLPDGSGIIFISDRVGTNDLYRLPLEDGIPNGEPEILKANLGDRTYILSITEMNSLLYVTHFDRSDVFTANVDFSTGEVISGPERISKMEDDRNLKPMWSPDGRYIAYLIGTSFWDKNLGNRFIYTIYDTKTGKSQRLETDLYGQIRNYWNMSQWSPDGNYILTLARTEDTLQGFFLVDVKNSESTPVFVTKKDFFNHSPQEIGYFPTFAKNGKDIFYLTADKKTIIRRNLESKQEIIIHISEEPILQYLVSPDESKIAIGYWTCGRNALYVVSTTGGDVQQIMEDQDDGTPYILTWTKDSKYILFEIGKYWDIGSHSIYRVPAAGGEPEQIFLSKNLYSNGEVMDMDIHPDGQQIVLGMRVGKGSEVWALENIFK